ncbi:MAG: acyl-CoA dehydrogenase family protein [Ktedonobacterales bacterium]
MIPQYVNIPVAPRQRELLAQAESLAERFRDRSEANDRLARFPHENFAELREAGFLALTVPEAYGGSGLKELDYTQVLEPIAWGDASTALVLGMHLSNVGQLVEGNLWPEHAPQLFREIVAQGAMLNAAQAEPELGSPSHGGLPATTARPTSSGDWHITGRKIYTTGAPGLRYFLLLATVVQDELPAQLGTFLLPHDAPGVHIEKTWDALALRASGSDDLVMDDAVVGKEALLDLRPAGTPDPRAALGLPWGSITLATIYTGLAVAAQNEAARFAATRVPTGLGKPIGELPTIQLKLGEIESLLLTSHRLLYGLAADWVNAPSMHAALRAQGPLVKSITTNNAIRITDLALRIIGGAGLQRSMRLEQLFRDARAGLINAPLDDVVWQNAGRASVNQASLPDQEE